MQKTASCCLNQYADAVGRIHLKQFPMKYLAFNNPVYIVFICKRVYFFDYWPSKGNRYDDGLSLTHHLLQEAAPLIDCWWEATLKLKDTGRREDSISIGTIK